MNDLRKAAGEAMRLALDMLNEIADDVYCDQKLEGVITTLRQALVDADDTSQERVDETTKCKHEWVGLTEPERLACYDLNPARFASAIEAKLKEKNNA